MPSESGPIVSVILPVYNREKFIVIAIKSVLAQTFVDWELVVIDDYSTDNSFQEASSFRDSRIQVIKSERNAGAAYARNLGMAKAKGAYISFLDSDDAYDPLFLEVSVRKIEATDPEIGFCWCGCIVYKNQNGKSLSKKKLWEPKLKESPYLTFLHDLKIGTSSGIIIKREVFTKVGLFDVNLPAAEDTDLFLRITQQYGFTYVSDYLINIYQIENDRLSKRFDKIAIAYNQIVPKHLESINKVKALRLKFFYKLMWLNYHLGDRSKARSYFLRVLKDRLLSQNAWLIFVLFEILGKRLGTKIHIQLSGLQH